MNLENTLIGFRHVRSVGLCILTTLYTRVKCTVMCAGKNRLLLTGHERHHIPCAISLECVDVGVRARHADDGVGKGLCPVTSNLKGE